MAGAIASTVGSWVDFDCHIVPRLLLHPNGSNYLQEKNPKLKASQHLIQTCMHGFAACEKCAVLRISM